MSEPTPQDRSGSAARPASDGRAGVIAGAVLIGLGVLFLLDRLVDIDLGAAGWPLFVVVPGLALLAWGVSMPGREGVGLAVGGGITTVVGLILAVQNATDLWATWAYAWALVGPGGTGIGLLAHGIVHRDGGQRTAGLRSIASGLGLFAAFGLFFEGVIGLSGPPFLSTDAGPIVLIAVGVVIIAIALARGRRPSA
ncbi:MAG: hypothetical protein M3Q66_02210 [Chloroflexota bacterium]|nr:hypothetical protein [Chloroflexota bacterium]